MFIFGLGYLALAYMAYYSGVYTKYVPNHRLHKIIKRSQQDAKNTKLLVIGDSVGAQLFEPDNSKDTVTNLTCNQAIDLIGHYMLLDDFLKKNEEVKTVYMVFNPFAFSNDLNHKFTYNYFVQPFYNQKYLDRFSDHAKSRMDSIPFSWLSTFPPLVTIFWQPKLSMEVDPNIFLSTISVEYLGKIKTLLAEKNIDFKLVAAPTRISRKGEFDAAKQRYFAADNQMSVFEDYFDDMLFLEDSLFMDHIHYEDPNYVRALVLEEYGALDNGFVELLKRLN